jgi:predicted ArsR family transcriptional regulator
VTVAARLGLSEKTVRNHLSSILLKLQVEDRSAAIVRAREAGLGRPVGDGRTDQTPRPEHRAP